MRTLVRSYLIQLVVIQVGGNGNGQFENNGNKPQLQSGNSQSASAFNRYCSIQQESVLNAQDWSSFFVPHQEAMKTLNVSSEIREGSWYFILYLFILPCISGIVLRNNA